MIETHNNQLNAPKYRRGSIRIKGYDYSGDAGYFITICAYEKINTFGEIVNSGMVLNELGKMVRDEWLKTGDLRKNVELDEFVIMPDHFHGIIHLCRGTARRAPTSERFGNPVSGSIPTIIRSFKSAVTKRINEHRNTPGRYVWQRNYYEHIIRNDIELNEKRQYIKNNPIMVES
jgi:REP element-mobilizing transposase RayT